MGGVSCAWRVGAGGGGLLLSLEPLSPGQPNSTFSLGVPRLPRLVTRLFGKGDGFSAEQGTASAVCALVVGLTDGCPGRARPALDMGCPLLPTAPCRPAARRSSTRGALREPQERETGTGGCRLCVRRPLSGGMAYSQPLHYRRGVRGRVAVPTPAGCSYRGQARCFKCGCRGWDDGTRPRSSPPGPPSGSTVPGNWG